MEFRTSCCVNVVLSLKYSSVLFYPFLVMNLLQRKKIRGSTLIACLEVTNQTHLSHALRITVGREISINIHPFHLAHFELDIIHVFIVHDSGRNCSWGSLQPTSRICGKQNY